MPTQPRKPPSANRLISWRRQARTEYFHISARFLPLFSPVCEQLSTMSFIKKHIKKLKGDSPPSSSDEQPGKEEGIAGFTNNGKPKEENNTGITGIGKSKPQKTNSWKIIGRKSTDLSRQSMDGSSTPDPKRQSQELSRDNRERRSLDKERNKIEAIKRVQLARIESAAFMETGPEEMTKLYRPFSMNQSKRRTHETRVLFKELNFAGMSGSLKFSLNTNIMLENEGKVICFRARIHTIRRLSAKLVFIVFRQQTITVQGILTVFRPKEEIVGMLSKLRTNSELG